MKIKLKKSMKFNEKKKIRQSQLLFRFSVENNFQCRFTLPQSEERRASLHQQNEKKKRK